MSVLDVIDPPDCDERGVPLDWERCRTCNGTGTKVRWPYANVDLNYDERNRQPCPACDGHGSLKAAALAELGPWTHHPNLRAKHIYRCEDCGHPMNEGTWEYDVIGQGDHEWAQTLFMNIAERMLCEGKEPYGAADDYTVHYSPCDEGCRHGGPVRNWRRTGGWNVRKEDDENVTRAALRSGRAVEASWRPVDVRTLGWAHDLRPEKLAILCLRCYAKRL